MPDAGLISYAEMLDQGRSDSMSLVSVIVGHQLLEPHERLVQQVHAGKVVPNCIVLNNPDSTANCVSAALHILRACCLQTPLSSMLCCLDVHARDIAPHNHGCHPMLCLATLPHAVQEHA